MILHLYILRRLLISMAFSIAGIALMVLPAITIQAIDKLGGVSMRAVLNFLPLVLVELVPYLLPIAFLLAVVSTYGQMSAQRELVAIQTAGIHPARIALPGVLVALFLSLWTYHLLANVAPEWKYQQRNFVRRAVIDAFENFAQGRTELEFGDSSLKASRAHDNVFEEVLLDLKNDNGDSLTVSATRAELSILDGVLNIELEEAFLSDEHGWVEVGNPHWSFPLAELFPIKTVTQDRPKYLSSTRIAAAMDGPEMEASLLDQCIFEIQQRRALACIYLIFLLLGIPTGIALRSTTQLGAFTAATVYCLVYYMLMMRLGHELVKSGLVPPTPAAWTTNAIFLGLGAIPFYRTLWR